MHFGMFGMHPYPQLHIGSLDVPSGADPKEDCLPLKYLTGSCALPPMMCSLAPRYFNICLQPHL